MITAEPWCHWSSGCSHPITVVNPLSLDHLVPYSRGGTDDPSNLLVLCKRHNSAKRDR